MEQWQCLAEGFKPGCPSVAPGKLFKKHRSCGPIPGVLRVPSGGAGAEICILMLFQVTVKPSPDPQPCIGSHVQCVLESVALR